MGVGLVVGLLGTPWVISRIVGNLALSDRMNLVRPSPTLAITARAKALAQQGYPVISFGAGEPDFNTPDPICQAAIQAMRNGETKYTPSAGLPALREEIAEKLHRENGLNYTADQITVSCGAKHSVYNALQVICNPGDEVILIAPYWMTYYDQIVLAGGIPKVIHTTAESGFSPSLDQLREAINAKTRAIILNSPCNPTGTMLSRDALKNIAAMALRHGFWIISDEIYEHLIYDAEHFSIAGLGQDVYAQTITVNGCSKTFAMTGWRIGYSAAPLEVAKAISKLQDQVTSNPTSFAQYGAIAALQLPPSAIAEMQQTFNRRRKRIVEKLSAIPGICCSLPPGAFYAFPHIGSLCDGDDLIFADRLLEDCHVAIVPGTVFEGRGHIRLSYATSDENIEEGVDRISKFVQTLRA